jgi:hypothetical protein
MRNIVRGTLLVVVLISFSSGLLFLGLDSRADIYYLHAESNSGIGSYMDLELFLPEPNATTVSVDVPSPGLYKIGEGWVQNDKFDYGRDMSGIWSFNMYGFCDDNIINGQLYAKVFDGTNTRLNTAFNRSEPIGPCEDPNSPVEITWDDELDVPQAKAFAPGERFRVEIWLDASSGGTYGTNQTASDEDLARGQIVDGSYLDTLDGNEGGTQYERLREEEIPCGPTTIFPVVNESGIEGLVAGDFTNLSANDEEFEEILEQGTPNSLEWNWTIDITQGLGQYTFFMDAKVGTAPWNNDSFLVEYSTTGEFAGEEQLMFVIDETWTGSFNDPPFAYYYFPDGALAGTNSVYIRAVDTNDLDTDISSRDVLKVDRMYIEFTNASQNCSALEHIWVIENIPVSLDHELNINGYHSISSDEDDFSFSYAFDNRNGRYQDVFILTNTTDEDFYLTSSIIIPSGFTTIWVKVEDTNHTADPSPALDDLFMDHIYVLTEAGGIPYQFHLIVDNDTYPSRIATVEYIVGTDTTPPVSSVLLLDTYQTNRTFEVHWVASDTGGSGLFGVELYYINPSGSVIRLRGVYDTSPINFTASQDGRYQFYTRGLDRAGNHENPPTRPDADTIVDTTPPTVREVQPSDLEEDVLRDTQIVIRFRESMDSISVNQAFELTDEDGKQSWEASDGTVVWNHPANDTFRFTLPEGELLDYGKKYFIIVDVGAEDKAGNNIAEKFQSSFETEVPFDPTWLIVTAVVAIVVMAVMIILLFKGRKKPEEVREEIPEVTVVPQMATPPPPTEAGPAPVETEARPLWESRKPSADLWKEKGPDEHLCTGCGRFVPEGATYCTFCGRKF